MGPAPTFSTPWAGLERSPSLGPHIHRRQIAQARLAITHGMRESVRAVDILFHAAGTNAVHRKHPLERFFRDIHVAVQHVAGLPSNIEAGGRVMLGLPPGGLGW